LVLRPPAIAPNSRACALLCAFGIAVRVPA
jgi:hypothetical protein